MNASEELKMWQSLELKLKFWQLILLKKQAKTDDERAELDRLIEERIRWVGSGQGDEP
ncbi:hypothetical protein [Xanthomonas oryzae]|uniref:hypothetical protein n=1 Tax=Xanthomonas oryzae TaxID=347 RepID=UPI001A92371C|nr:hypothetical protein [Xanthomonas oryzae]